MGAWAWPLVITTCSPKVGVEEVEVVVLKHGCIESWRSGGGFGETHVNTKLF